LISHTKTKQNKTLVQDKFFFFFNYQNPPKQVNLKRVILLSAKVINVVLKIIIRFVTDQINVALKIIIRFVTNHY
jgi:hypothetical protein